MTNVYNLDLLKTYGDEELLQVVERRGFIVSGRSMANLFTVFTKAEGEQVDLDAFSNNELLTELRRRGWRVEAKLDQISWEL